VTHGWRVSHTRRSIQLHTLIRFGLTGALGFLVDAGVLHLIVTLLGMNLFLARGCSFICAATTTWVINRRVTFSATPRLRRGILTEWAAYFVASLGGGCVNYLAFAVAVRLSPVLHEIPSIAVGIGTIAGTAFNFVMYVKYVFRVHDETGPVRPVRVAKRLEIDPRNRG
jgi:putative flippase GtrA